MQQVSKKPDQFSIDSPKSKVYPKFLSEIVQSDPKLVSKCKLKFKKREKIIFGLIRDDSPSGTATTQENSKDIVGGKKESRRRKKESSFNTGRWHTEEHQRFIEALLKFGNDWKSVQRYVGSRSSTQARSHAQKFFVKIGKTQIENLQLDFENNSLKSLNIMANNLNNDQMARAIKSLNELAFDKKNSGRKTAKAGKINENGFNAKFEGAFELGKSDDSEFGIFSNGDKITCGYSTGIENSTGCPLIKRKRIRTLKRKQTFESSIFIKENNENNININALTAPIHGIGQLMFYAETNLFTPDVDDCKLDFRKLCRPPMSSALCSNRKSSIDFNYGFNLFNDNSIFTANNNSFRSSLKVEEKEFQLVFENSFKKEEELFYNDDVDGIFFVEENLSSQRKSSFEIDDPVKFNNDIIEQFMD